jgi:selenocysteine-specific elongation factor
VTVTQVIATAGHVDHGKSTLVRALTGMEPDRWEEERRRGLTIDLGFAWMKVAPGPGGPEQAPLRIAFVDVPGHERFVPNMLAGLGPVPAVLLVVAADGGWMPQSAEHLAAIDALGISRGLLVVTRADLADPEPALRRARAELAATSLAGAQAVAVSAVTGAGLPELRRALGQLAGSLPVPDPAGPQRHGGDRHAAGRDRAHGRGTAADAVAAPGAGTRHRVPGAVGRAGPRRGPGRAQPARRAAGAPHPGHGADRAGPVDADRGDRRPV